MARGLLFCGILGSILFPAQRAIPAWVTKKRPVIEPGEPDDGCHGGQDRTGSNIFQEVLAHVHAGIGYEKGQQEVKVSEGLFRCNVSQYDGHCEGAYGMSGREAEIVGQYFHIGYIVDGMLGAGEIDTGSWCEEEVLQRYIDGSSQYQAGGHQYTAAVTNEKQEQTGYDSGDGAAEFSHERKENISRREMKSVNEEINVLFGI